MDEITDKQKAFLLKSGIKISYGMSKQEASKMIDEIINKGKPKAEVQESKPFESKKSYDTSSFYVAYSKDLCIAMLNAHAATMQSDATVKPVDIGLLMAQAILCIKQAQKEFQ